jgi:hypothetical protein
MIWLIGELLPDIYTSLYITYGACFSLRVCGDCRFD